MAKQDRKIKSMTELRKSAIDAHQNKDLDLAQELYQIYLRYRPKDAAVWSNLGALFRTQKKYQMASIVQSRAIEIEPDNLTLMNNAANAFYDAGDIEKALKLRETIIKNASNNPDNYTSLGKCYRGMHRLNDAKKILNIGIERFPDFAELHIQLAFVLLAQGNYPDGFKSFNWRWKGDELTLPEFDFPKWNGEDLNGKTILVAPEQGFGDTVLMARFLDGLKAFGPKIKMIVKDPLKRLFENLQKDIEFVETKNALQGCDFWVPIMDLPLYLNTKIGNLPPPVKLSIPKEAKVRARQITAPYKDKFKLGVMWSGSVTYRANHKRSFGHQRFLELCDIPNMQMFSLYKGPILDDFIKDGTSSVIIDAAGNDRDFADSAALMQELDLIVSMDSAIVHVAGTLGLDVWNLLHSEPYWLYVPFPDHSPWYPSMRLITQQTSGDWDSTFAILKNDITKLVIDWKKNNG